MKIKEIEPYLPKYSDGSGYDVDVRYNTDEHGGPWCERDSYHPSTKPGQRELTIKSIAAGCPGFGGSYDDTLTIYVEESEMVEADPVLVQKERDEYEAKMEAKREAERLAKEAEEKKIYEKWCRKIEENKRKREETEKAPYLKKFEERYQNHEEYPDEESAKDMAKCDGYKDYRIVKGYSCWHYFYNKD